MVRYLNGWSMGYVLCTRPTIHILDQYIRKQDCVQFSGIQMAFENQTIWHPTSFRPLKNQTSLVFRSPVYCLCRKEGWNEGKTLHNNTNLVKSFWYFNYNAHYINIVCTHGRQF